ncbi:MAG: LysM peptidoglycan-binding domain-containing protein [Pseudomonadota bacterium]
MISLTLSACSSIPTEIETPIIETPVPVAETTTYSQSVVEILVNEAEIRRKRAFAIAPPALESQQEETDPTAIQPITTTVAMTANRVVERSINDFLQNRQSLLRTWVSRGQIYFPMIEKIFAEEGIPDELKYLALGESSLTPTIRSSAGAVGMWQFMAATARGEGLRVDSWVDERRDPEKSTRAAAQHLKALNESYNGRWHLSLAGYNCSYRCIKRAVELAGGTLEDPPSFWDIYPNLPRETREFVPGYIATSLIISNPKLYGIEVEDLGQEFAYDVVKIQGMLSLEEAARLAGTDMATIHNLNPSLLKSTLPEGDEPYELKIPLETYDNFVAAFNKAMPSSVAGTGEYRVQSGDSLGKIAKKFGVTTDELRSANNIAGDRINIDQNLLVPGAGSSGNIAIVSQAREYVAYEAALYRPIKLGEEFKLVQQSGSTAEKPLVAVSLEMASEDEGAINLVPTVYKVQRGDSLSKISQRFGVSVASIQQANNLNGTAIMANQELTIHSAARTVDDPTPPEALKTYQVQTGDNLFGIARRFGISVDNLKRWNSLRNNMIYPGQSLQLN